MSKKYSIFITALFCVFIFGFGIAFFVLPDKDFSEQENRYLSQFKAPTLETLKNGKFMEDFEDYVVDQFPLRDQWIQLKAASEKAIGKQENNAVYFGTDGQTLFAHFTAPDDLEKRVEYVNKLASKTDVPVYFGLIPDKSFVWADRLPAHAPNVDDGSTLAEAEALCADNVTWIDVALSGDDVFYRTDHHWSTFGAYQGYQAIAQALNGSYTTPEGEPTQVSDSFLGTTYSACGAGWVEPDSIYTWVAEEGIEVERYPEGMPIEGELYDESFLDKKDKYSMFLGGNQPLCILRNENAATDKKLLIVRDSYTDSLAPFLAQDFAEIHLMDLRYCKIAPSTYIAENGIDQALVLYSAANFASDNNLFILGLG
ncbi:MAG: DHHW family protein [Oscillospiraceae bacterium]